MNKLTLTDRFFWIFLVLALGLGLGFPAYFQQFEGLIIYIIMIIMGLLFLKVDILDLITHIKKPLNILYISFVKLLVLPILVFFMFNNADINLKMALFLLAALPTGVSSAAFTDIMKGRTSLTLTTIVVTNLLCIFTIPFLFFVLFQADLQLDVHGLFVNLSKIIFIPFIIAKIIKRLFIPNVVQQLQSYLNLKIMILLSFMVAISISFQADLLLTTLPQQLINLVILFACFIIFQLVGYFSVFWKEKEEKIAISNSFMIMNNILGIVLAIGFFNHEVLMIVLLSLIPWNVMIIAKNLYKNYLP